MFRRAALQNRITYAEVSKMSRDYLLEQLHRTIDPDTELPRSTWANISCDLSSLKAFESVQNVVCVYCGKFVADLLGRSAQQLSSTSDSKETPGIVYAKPRFRRLIVVIENALKGCWICTHVVHNIRTTAKTKLTAILVSLHAFNISLDILTVSAFDQKRHLCYSADFRIAPVEAPASLHRALRPESKVFRSTWHPDGLSKARAWIRTCEEEHENCRQVEKDVSKSYPSRLLDLANVGQGSIVLVAGASIPEGAKYASLSHCWGNAKHLVLLKSNFVAYSNRLPVDDLPKTFSDAVQICADLEIRYLWIDSLCIIQDDKDDWTAEAPRMAEIYSNSYVNLAATAAFSDAEGLLRPFVPCLVSPYIFRVADESDADQHFKLENDENFGTYVNKAPLNSRAWVFQERALSRRILHFGNDQIYWQCPSNVDAQFDIRIDPMDKVMASPWQYMQQWRVTAATNRELEGNIPDNERQALARGNPLDHPLLNKWEDILQDYSECDLTYTSDKLIAVAGLAKRIQWLTNWPDAEYLAGLWRQGLERRLLWMTFSPGKSVNPEVPSWSWAHINSHVLWPPTIWTEKKNTTGDVLLEVVSASTTPENAALGSVKHGTIQLRGLLCLMTLHRSPWEDFHPRGSVRSHNKWTALVKLEAHFDLKTSWWGVFGRKIVFLPVIAKLFISPDDAENAGRRSRSLYGLMLEPMGQKEGQYRRVGVLEVDEDAFDLVQHAVLTSSLDKKYFLQADAESTYIFEII